MGDKFDGTLAGMPVPVSLDVASALQGLTLHETLLAKDEDGNTILLRAIQNPVSGGIMMLQAENQDHSELMLEAVKRSQMTSMLADTDRCSKYNEAIKGVLATRPGAKVLDIGTGTGLLAMLAANAGASHVTAVEMFRPLADLAAKIVRANDLGEKISVVCASSTDMSTTGSDEHGTHGVLERSDVLVTEIFDSALLGEDCLRAIKHAHQNLLKDGASVIPARARLYATVVSSDFFSKFCELGHDFPLHRDSSGSSCRGGSIGIPVHLNGLVEGVDYEVLTDPFQVFEFDFTRSNIPLYRQVSKRFGRRKGGPAQGILTWWELDLTEDGSIVYSTKSEVENWQDHWLQVVYPLPTSEHTSSSDNTIPITMEHDESSFSFALGLGVEPSVLCGCGFHSIMKPYRIHELGGTERLEKLSSGISEAIDRVRSFNSTSQTSKPILCIDVSDNSLCAVLAGRINSPSKLQIYSVEEDNEVSSFLFGQIAKRTKAQNNDVFVEFDPLSAFIERQSGYKKETGKWEGFDIILSEPFTRAMHGYPVASLGNLVVQRLALSEILNTNFTMVPSVGCLQAQLVGFPPGTIQSSFKAIDNVQGLDFSTYSRLLSDEEWDQSQQRLSLPLFQYNVTERSDKVALQKVEFCTKGKDFLPRQSQTWIPMNGPGEVDAISLSVLYDDIPLSRVARFEVIWLNEVEKVELSKAGGVRLTCEFERETGTWRIHFDSPHR